MNVALEIIRRDDVDGIHFDFMRYPGESFPDQTTHDERRRHISRQSAKGKHR